MSRGELQSGLNTPVLIITDNSPCRWRLRASWDWSSWPPGRCRPPLRSPAAGTAWWGRRMFRQRPPRTCRGTLHLFSSNPDSMAAWRVNELTIRLLQLDRQRNHPTSPKNKWFQSVFRSLSAVTKSGSSIHRRTWRRPKQRHTASIADANQMAVAAAVSPHSPLYINTRIKIENEKIQHQSLH